VLSGAATNTNFVVFGLTRPELESTTYRTRGEHANHYTTDPVNMDLALLLLSVGCFITLSYSDIDSYNFLPFYII